MTGRQPIYDALVAVLTAALTTGPNPPCRHVGTDWKSINQESPATLPRVYVTARREPLKPESVNPPEEKIDINLVIYVTKGGLNNNDVMPILNPILDAIDTVVGRQAKDPTTQRDITLGGLVKWCRRSADTEIFMDVLSEPSIAVIPVQILVNQ